MRHLMIGIMGLAFFAFLNSCKKELSVENLAPAKGSLQSSGGDCLPKTIAGSYIAAKALTDSNYIEVTVNVASAGPYIISTDSLNGYYFRATGVFAATGTTTVRLKGTGSPVSASVDDFTVVFDSSRCDISIIVSPAGTVPGPAAYTMVCNSFTSAGNYVKDSVLNSTNTVSVKVNVTAIGTYTITTNTVNGYSFSGSGNFSSTTNPQTVILNATGKPVAAGTDNFTATAGSATCTFPITVTATAPVTSPCGASAQGTYTVGTALTAANTILISHAYATAGTYTVSSNTVNGYSFGPATISATAGANSITLTGTGTPLATGFNTFTVSFGDGQTCTFTVTVNAAATVVNNDYFPTTQTSYWTYNDGSSTVDTFKMIVNGTQVFGANTYQKFVYSGLYTGNEYYRKDAATQFYYQSFDTAGYGQFGIFFSQPRFDVLFLKNTLTTNATWNSDVNVTASGVPAMIRNKFTCVDANTTLTVNGKLFNNVYKISQVLQLGSGTTFQDKDGPYYLYYAKGIGLIYWEDNTSTPADPIQSIRVWQVN